jgi:hypothetical protein
MARGMAAGEGITSQAQSAAFDEGADRLGLGKSERARERGRFIWDEQAQKLVRAEDYRAPERAIDAPIIADRIHEGTHFDDGQRVRNIGSRRKRREFLRETGLSERSDYGPGWRERTRGEHERQLDRKTDGAFEQAAKKLYHQGKLR